MTYHLRNVTMDDAATLLDARNRDDVRRFMTSQHVISMDEHQKWLQARIANMSYAPYCLFLKDDVPVGVVGMSSYDTDRNIGEWGFYLCDPTGESGVGTMMLAAFCEAVFFYYGMPAIDAKVQLFNDASLYLHGKLGFVQTRQNSEFIFFELTHSSWHIRRSMFESLLKEITYIGFKSA